MFDGFLMVAGLAEHLVIQYRELIGANDECVAGVDGDSFRFFPRQMTREFLRAKPLVIAFIDIGRDRFVLIEKTIKQAPPVL